MVESRINVRSASRVLEIRAFYRRRLREQGIKQASPDAFYIFWACSLGRDSLRWGATEIISHKRANCYILSVTPRGFEPQLSNRGYRRLIQSETRPTRDFDASDLAVSAEYDFKLDRGRDSRQISLFGVSGFKPLIKDRPFHPLVTGAIRKNFDESHGRLGHTLDLRGLSLSRRNNRAHTARPFPFHPLFKLVTRLLFIPPLRAIKNEHGHPPRPCFDYEQPSQRLEGKLIRGDRARRAYDLTRDAH